MIRCRDRFDVNNKKDFGAQTRGVAQLVARLVRDLLPKPLPNRGVAQLVARLVRDQEVPGSNPGAPIRQRRANVEESSWFRATTARH